MMSKLLSKESELLEFEYVLAYVIIILDQGVSSETNTNVLFSAINGFSDLGIPSHRLGPP